jgi:hypothetical protein
MLNVSISINLLKKIDILIYPPFSKGSIKFVFSVKMMQQKNFFFEEFLFEKTFLPPSWIQPPAAILNFFATFFKFIFAAQSL